MKKSLAVVITALFVSMFLFGAAIAQDATETPTPAATQEATPVATQSVAEQMREYDNNLMFEADNWLKGQILAECAFMAQTAPRLVSTKIIIVPSSGSSMGAWVGYAVHVALYNSGLLAQEGQCYISAPVQPDEGQPNGVTKMIIMVMELSPAS